MTSRLVRERTLHGSFDAGAVLGELLARYAARDEVISPAAIAQETHVLPSVGNDARVALIREREAIPAADLVVVAGDARARFVFDAARFDDVSADRIAEHFRRVVAGDDEIVGCEERSSILTCSKAAETRFDLDDPTVIALFEGHARLRPSATALVDGDRTLTYCELDAAADALADRLRTFGAGPRSRVAVYLERGADAVISFLAILKARSAYVPIDTGYPAGRVAAILETAEPTAILTRLALASALPDEHPTLFVDRPDADEVTIGVLAARTPPSRDDAAYAIFTSGSTGRPKGVVVDHRSLASYARAASEAYRVGPNDRVLQAASLGFDLSLEEIVITLTAGAALVIRSAPPIASIQAFCEECVERGVTVLSITSALWHELTIRIEDGSTTLPPKVGLVILGADAARPDVLAVWQRVVAGRVRLVNSYGLTETTIVATVWEAGVNPLEDGWRALPVGRPLSNASAYVLDARGRLAPIGVPGEICIGGLAVACGYLGDDALTAAKFVADPFIPGRRMYKTGDRGVLRASGELEFLGRSDYQLKVNGVRIELGEIETRLREVAGVVEAIVVARKNPAGETELEAFVMASSTEIEPAILRARLEQVIPRAAVPGRIRVVDRFPLTPAGKIDRRALATMQRADEFGEVVAPATELERTVAAVIAEVLGLRRVGMRDGFVDLGGTSLSAVRAASILGHRLGVRVRAPIFLEAKTVADVCGLLVTVPSSTELPPTIEEDIVLDPSIAPHTSDRPGPPWAVLLTGATGFYGTFLLAELLRETPAHVVCVVRAPSPEVARERVLSSLERRRCDVDPASLAARVSVVVGDIARPNLGIEDAIFARLADSVDVIVHAGAKVNMMLPYAALRSSNVIAVESVLRLATTGRPKTVHHVSTVEVLSDIDRHEPGALFERLASSSAANLHDGYAQSKWAAEKLVEAARFRGIPARIHRPGRLMGHSRTGAFNDDDLLVRMLEACGRIGAVPALDVVVDVTPVDYASRALVRLLRADADADAFHLVHPQRVSWSAFVGLAVELGYPLSIVSHGEWRARLRGVAFGPQADFFLYLCGLSHDELAASIHGGWATETTRAALGDDPCAPIDLRLVSAWLRRLVDAGRFPASNHEAPPSSRSVGKVSRKASRLEVTT